jgi:hypothetical protein
MPGDGCVVFFTRTDDAEVSRLERLVALLGVPSLRIDADALGPIQVDLAAPATIRIGGHAVHLTVSWTRRFWASAMRPVRTPVDVLHRDTWLALAGQLARSAPAALPGPRIGLIEQLTDAAASGVQVPVTVVSTDPAEAAGRLPGDQVVLKVLDNHFIESAPGTLHGFLPRVLPRAAAAKLDASSRIPFVVQEYVRHEAEYRVYFMGGELITFEVRKPAPAAIWCEPDAVRVRLVADVPADVAGAVVGLAERWTLGYGAFDMLATDRGAVFLEVNTDGDWRWYEAKAGVRSVSRDLALMIRDLHLISGGKVSRSRNDLLTVMAG